MPIMKPSTIERKRRKLLKVAQEHDFSPNEIAKALGTSHQNISQKLERYGIHQEMLKISEELGFGNKEAVSKIIEHAKSENPSVSLSGLELWLKSTKDKSPGSTDKPSVEINTHQINIVTSKAVADAMSRYKQLVQ